MWLYVGSATGAMSHALVKSLSQNRHQTFTQILQSTRQILQGKYTQVPQMTSGHKMDMNTMFIM